jgi:hypothetical protein
MEKLTKRDNNRPERKHSQEGYSVLVTSPSEHIEVNFLAAF